MMGYGTSRKLANSPLHFIIIVMVIVMKMTMWMMRKQLKINDDNGDDDFAQAPTQKEGNGSPRRVDNSPAKTTDRQLNHKTRQKKTAVNDNDDCDDNDNDNDDDADDLENLLTRPLIAV